MQWRVQALFQIKLHERDLVLLNKIKDFFSVGTLVKDGTKVSYTVKSVKNLIEVIIPHFDSFPLLTKKYADFLLFKQILTLMARKGHLNQEDFNTILSLRANLNLGISWKLKLAFPDIVPTLRPIVPLRTIDHPYWLTGFIDGEGYFSVRSTLNIKKYHYKLDNERTDKIWLTFQITQHSRDVLFMESIIKYLDCGRVRNRNSTPTVDFLVNRYTDIDTKIISFLDKYPLQSVKQKDFKDFCKATDLTGSKEHLTVKGMEKIKNIKNGMNTKR